MKAVVLAAGEGTRLRPLTFTKPKPMLPIGGKPILEHVLYALKEAGIKDIYIIVHYMAEKVKQYFGDGSKHELKIEYLFQPEPRGTADALLVAEPHLNEDFMLVYGDLLVSSKAVQRLIQTFKRENPMAVMAVVPVENPEHYGVVGFQGNRVTKIVEKPSKGKAPSNLANAGIYVFTPEIFKEARKTKTSTRGELELTDSITMLAEQGKEVIAEKISREDWMDIGFPWSLLEANEWTLKKAESKLNGTIESGATITGPAIIEENARIRAGAYVEGPVYIGENSDIGPNCYLRPFTSIGKNVRIGNACEIKNSIIMNGTHIGHLSYVGDSIIGENCNLGAGTITANLRFDKKPVKMMIKGEKIDSGRKKLGVVLGDNVSTGIGAMFMPGVKIGNDCWIDAGAIIREDIPPKTFVKLRQSLESDNLRLG